MPQHFARPTAGCVTQHPVLGDGSAYQAGLAQLFFAGVRRAGEALGAELHGVEWVPRTGAALLVANHTFGFDVAFPLAVLLKQLGRPVWVLGDHAWMATPAVRSIAGALGVVDGNPEVAHQLLQRGELVLVLPGGLREAVKPRELRYQLLWGERYGFVRLAIRHGVPLIPLACVGADDLFDFVGNAYTRGRRWLGLAHFPLPLPARILPIPHRASLRFVIGEPIMPHVGPEQSDDLASLRWLRREVAGALHELIETELARRLGIQLS
jgi:1-acyl-sn-glycerol-3-phosphate acyltransferase